MTKRFIMEKLSRRGEEDTFDREFWRKVGHEGRFAATWEMVNEADLFRGKNVSQSRLQKSVQTIKRRKS